MAWARVESTVLPDCSAGSTGSVRQLSGHALHEQLACCHRLSCQPVSDVYASVCVCIVVINGAVTGGSTESCGQCAHTLHPCCQPSRVRLRSNDVIGPVLCCTGKHTLPEVHTASYVRSCIGPCLRSCCPTIWLLICDTMLSVGVVCK